MARAINVGTLVLHVSKLTLGQLRHDAELNAAVGALAGNIVAKLRAGIPDAADIAAMMTIAFAATAPNRAEGFTRAKFDAAFDELPFDDAFKALGECVGAAMYTTARGVPASGEDVSPSSSISDDSTGSSSPQQGGAIPSLMP